MVSILMISYNSSLFIREAIDSVLAQTYNNFELIICDDNSTDKTWSVIDSYKSDKLVKIKNEENLGEYANRNKAIELARGQYLIFIDADDIIYPHGLEFMLRYAIMSPDCGMIISRPWDERIIYPAKISPQQFYCFEYLDKGVIGINFTKVLFKSEAVKSKIFPPKVKFGDLYLQYEVGLIYPSLLIPDASTWWRRTAGQASEKLLSDPYLYFKHALWIQLDKLADPMCPLDEKEKHRAYKNIYGNYLRYLFRKFLKLKILRVFDLYYLYPVPVKYLSSIALAQHRDYFSSFTGNNPMQSTFAK